ncbi:hypothetical protein LJC39_00375 [Parabacteroides sp. OttesenSCG-928-B22]|nr:hypothetical protein [Parabacteroides sp. OttesenSCG-928-B22]
MKRHFTLAIIAALFLSSPAGGQDKASRQQEIQTIELNGQAGGKRFDGVGLVNGGGATSVLLKDYPEPQRSQILDMVYKPMFGASVSALFVEIPGDGNSTQGSMPSHMHTRDDLNYSRGYTWWILREAQKRNPNLTLDGTAWSAPGWIGDGTFWSQDAADYYVKWLEGLRDVYGLEFTAIGCRNEKGASYDFAKLFRKTLNANGFENIKLHAFDHWPKGKLDFVKDMLTDKELRDAIDIIGGHVFYEGDPVSEEEKEIAEKLGKPIWNTEDHVYKKGFDCLISLVECFNNNYIRHGATKIVNWYDIAGIYPLEPYSEDPPTVLAYQPWSGHYKVRQALWGYAHYGQFSQIGWEYLNGACTALTGGGSLVTLKAPSNDYSIMIETKEAKAPQQLRFHLSGELPAKTLCVWSSNEKEQFVRQADIIPVNNTFTLTLEPQTVYSISTTTGQQKGSFENIPEPKSFPFPYYETFEPYTSPEQWGYLPRYMADIYGTFELVDRPDNNEKCLRQVVAVPPISWAPGWKPYSIIGDENWQDYEVSADVYLNPGDAAALMGRVNHVGTGYGFIPKGYYLQLEENGNCSLVVVRGKINKKELVGDAEQQAIIKSGKDEGEGGEKVLATIQLPNVKAQQWYNLKLRFEGSSITGFIDGKQVLQATDNLYEQGMAGILTGAEKERLSTPYFDNLLINEVNGKTPQPSKAGKGQTPIYEKGNHAKDQFVLNPADFRYYIEKFNENDDELYPQYIPNQNAWGFLEKNIPFFECPDKEIETTYYFRWWTFRKHIKQTPTGFIISEFLPSVYWAGKYNSISCAAGHHFYEGRWLKNNEFLHAYAKFWFTEGNPRMYSFWAANALWEYFNVTQDSVALELLPDLITNYQAWEKGWQHHGHFIGRNSDGLFSTYDDRDAMEMQIGGSGKRPTINSYMYGDAMAIAKMAEKLGQKEIQTTYRLKADTIKNLVLKRLWDKKATFFKTRSEKDNQWVDVREQHGYTPWYFNLPTEGKGYEKAWEYIKRNDGFNAPYGLTTAEQSHPQFIITYKGHECQWNGPLWPYSTSVTLTALANLLNNYEQDVVTKADYYEQFVKYSLSHRIVDEEGRILPWIDENQNPYTGDWISRTRLKAWNDGTWSEEKGGVERGKDYNHSTYCDNLISGLVGIRTQEDNSLVVNPLIPDKAWEWFCLDGVSYKGKTITVLYDREGTKYGKGCGLMVFVDGEMKAQSEAIRKLKVAL